MKPILRQFIALSATVAALHFALGCSDKSPTTPGDPGNADTVSIQVINTYPHDSLAFTQGLQWVDSLLVEGTGISGQSTLRLVDLASGSVLYSRPIATHVGGTGYFGEGVCVVGDRIYQLTWLDHIGFIYDKQTFDSIGYFTYPTQGWGLTHDGSRFIMSDGTSRLYFWDTLGCHDCAAMNADAIPHVTVHDGDRTITQLNELEYVNGSVYANVWQTDYIVRISPSDGKVQAWLDCRGLLTTAEQVHANVLNGIAYDPNGDRMFITGKYWPKLFQVQTVQTEGTK